MPSFYNKVSGGTLPTLKDWGDFVSNGDTLKSIMQKGYKIVFRKQHMVVLHKDADYMVWNTELNFDCGHSHLKSLKMAQQLCRNVVCEKMPKTKNIYLLHSHIRTLPDCDYKDKIEDLIQVKEDKMRGNNYYFNVNKGCQ